MKYEITFWEDQFTMVDEIVVEANDVNELKYLADKYCEENLKDKEIAGANWIIVE